MVEITARMVEVPSNGHVTPAYLAKPSGDGPFPGLIAIQEWWGLVPHMKDVAERLAREGFIVLAPDLYHGHNTEEPDEARKLEMELDRDHVIKEIAAGIAYLQQMKDIAPKKVAAVGWSLGATLAVAAASSSRDVAAVVAFYGGPDDLNDVKDIRAPILALYGAEDTGFPPEYVHAFEEQLDKHAIPHAIQIYPDAGNAFFNDTRPDTYHRLAATDAWQRTLSWLRKYLT
jgi:carboxymethylenebutenolidase